MEASTLFSGIDRPYNNVTSPDQQDANSTGNDQGPSDQAPMSKILAAVMRGAAQVQGQEQAKRLSVSQQTSNAKMSVTMKPGLPGEPPRVTVKDAPADLLNGTQQNDLAQAYTNPSKQVEQKLSGTAPVSESADNAPDSSATTSTITPPQTAAPAGVDVVDHTLGYHLPRGADPDITEKLKTPQGIRDLNYELGGNEEHARITIEALKKGRITPQEVHDRVAVYRERKYAQIHSEIQGSLDKAQAEQDRQDRLTFAKQEEKRRLKTQSDAELKTGNDEKLNWLKSTDLALVDPSQLEATARASTNAPWTDSDINRAKLKLQQDVNKAFNDFTDTKKNTFSLGNYDSWDAAKAAFGHPLTPAQDSMGAGRWKADHNYVLRQNENETIKRQHADDQHEMTMLRIANASKEKPVAVNRSDLNLMSAAEVLSLDPVTTKNYDSVLEQKEGLLKKEIATHTDTLTESNAPAKAILSKPAYRRQFGDEEQLAGYQAKATVAKAHIAAAQAELQQIQAARAARKGGTAVTPAVVPGRLLTKAEALKKLSGK